MDTIKTEQGTVAGGTSIIIIFITISIAIYGLLAVYVARNELELNRKNRDAAVDYYAADAAAAKILFEISAARFGRSDIYEIDGVSILYDEMTSAASFVISIDEFRELNVSVSFPQNGGFMEIVLYRVTSSQNWHEQTEKKINVITDFGE